MIARDTSSRNTHAAMLGNTFTSDELERLMALREGFIEHAEHSEYLMDPAQLEFERWLYEHGRIGEHPRKK